MMRIPNSYSLTAFCEAVFKAHRGHVLSEPNLKCMDEDEDGFVDK